MMAALILAVGFIGLIEAVTLSATAMDHARRQTLASQIINHEIEELRLLPWDNSLASPNESAINKLTTARTTLTIDSRFDQARLSLGDDGTASAIVRFSLSRTVTSPNPVTNIREVNFTVTWVVTTSRLSGGSRLTFTYSRSASAWYGKNGLNLSYQQT